VSFTDAIREALGYSHGRTGLAALQQDTCQPPACGHDLSNISNNGGFVFEFGKAGSVATPLAQSFNSNSQYWLPIFLAAFTMKS
jgi:hypothetical protein